MRISSRKNPNNSNEFWCSYCLVYHPKNHFSRRSAAPLGIAPHCKIKDKLINSHQYSKKNHNKLKTKRRKNRGESCDLLACNRSSLKGFLTYYSNRPSHFQEIFGYIYSEKIARSCFKILQDEVGI